MAMTQEERTKKYHERNGIKMRSFALDQDTISRIERLSEQLGQSKTGVLRDALRFFEKAIEGGAYNP